MDRPGAGEEPGRLLHALQEGADSGEAWQQERSRRLGAKAIDILTKDKAPDESAIKNAQQIIDSSK